VIGESECSQQRYSLKDAGDDQKQKSLHLGGLGATFRFFSYAQSLLKSGAKVKKEAENNSVHVDNTLLIDWQPVC
jgi:hypothetical protein